MFNVIYTVYTERTDRYGTKQKFKSNSFGPFNSLELAKEFMESLALEKISYLKEKSFIQIETNLNRDRLSITKAFSSFYQCFDYSVVKS
ncbi:MAG: hypothetical protein ACRC41_00910 [Sarcina sp.]